MLPPEGFAWRAAQLGDECDEQREKETDMTGVWGGGACVR